jgi:hypothetical protein
VNAAVGDQVSGISTRWSLRCTGTRILKGFGALRQDAS